MKKFYNLGARLCTKNNVGTLNEKKYFQLLVSCQYHLETVTGDASRSIDQCVLAMAKLMVRYMNGWIICDFTSFSSVFEPHQDDGWVIIRDCVQWNPVYDLKDPLLKGARTRDHLNSRPELSTLRFTYHVCHI